MSGRPGSRQTLLAADEIVIVATPDLACLRNAKNIIDLVKRSRARTTRRRAGAQPGRRAQAAGNSGQGFRRDASGVEPALVIPFDPAAVRPGRQQRPDAHRSCSPSAPVAEGMRQLAELVTGRAAAGAAQEERALVPSLPQGQEAGVSTCSASVAHPTKRRARAAAPAPARRRRRAAPRRAAAARRAAPAPRAAAPPPQTAPQRCQRRPRRRSHVDNRSEDYYQIKIDDLQRADRHHRSGAAGAARSGFGARGNPRHRQRDHLDQERS